MADPHDPSTPHDPSQKSDKEHREDESIDFDVVPQADDSLSALGLGKSGAAHDLHASSEDFDFTEPTDFAFPSAEHEGQMDSGLFEHELAEGHDAESDLVAGHFDPDHLGDAHPGATTEMSDFGDMPSHADDGIPIAAASEGAAVEAAASEDEKPARKKRELPKWVGTAQWVLIGALPVIAVVANVISIRTLTKPTIDPIWHISYLVLLLLIPLALWRSKDRWIAPRVSATYTVMLALATGFLLTGVWMLGTELSRYDWAIKMKKVRMPSPAPLSSMEVPHGAPIALATIESCEAQRDV